MEEMYSDGDIQKIAEYLKLPDYSDYETVIASLYDASPFQKKKVKSLISKETIENFNKLSILIEKSFVRNYGDF